MVIPQISEIRLKNTLIDFQSNYFLYDVAIVSLAIYTVHLVFPLRRPLTRNVHLTKGQRGRGRIV